MPFSVRAGFVVSVFIFSKLAALGGERSVPRPFVFKKLTALGLLAAKGHEVVMPLVQFVGLPHRSPADLAPTCLLGKGRNQLP
jgi:hypothetical protein